MDNKQDEINTVETTVDNVDKKSKNKRSKRLGKIDIANIIVWALVTIAILSSFISSYIYAIEYRCGNEPINGCYDDDSDILIDYKPVIYLYPLETTAVNVKLDLDGELTCTYPKYNNETGWNVTARPTGTLTSDDSIEFNYLYWEGTTNANYDLSKGYCVAGEDTAKFLEVKLEELGLNRREANEFIVYWLPQMETNKYNLIAFQTDAYTEAAKLNVEPTPDSIIRVFMVYKSLDEYTDIEAQEFDVPKREGFTVVEWGGTEVTNRRQ